MGLGSTCWWVCVYVCVCARVCVCVCALSHVQLFVTPWTIAHHTPLSLEFSRQEYWSELPFPLQGNFLDQGLNCIGRQILYHCLGSPSMWFTSSSWWGFEFLQNNSRTWLRILSLALEEELKVLCFALWLNSYYFLFLDYFPSFLPFSHFYD